MNENILKFKKEGSWGGGDVTFLCDCNYTSLPFGKLTLRNVLPQQLDGGLCLDQRKCPRKDDKFLEASLLPLATVGGSYFFPISDFVD